MKLIEKTISIAEKSLSVEMPETNWQFIKTLKDDPKCYEYSNVENLILEAYVACQRNDIKDEEFGRVLSSWLVDAFKNKTLLGYLRPFPRSEPIVVLSDI